MSFYVYILIFVKVLEMFLHAIDYCFLIIFHLY